jgi:uncharacterized membrane protein
MVIHFPIALLLASALLDGIAWISRRPRLHDSAFLLLALGTAAAGAAVLTGDAAHDAVKNLPGIVEPLEAHEKLGFFTLWIAGAATLLRLVARRERSRGAFVAVAVLTAVCLTLLVRTAIFGGRLVYEHGAGVKPVMHAHPDTSTAAPQGR